MDTEHGGRGVVSQGARALRALRVLLLVKNIKSIKTIFTTLIISIPPTLNIMCDGNGTALRPRTPAFPLGCGYLSARVRRRCLLCILILVYGILGVQLYGGLPVGPRIHYIDNFDGIMNAMMVLFQVLRPTKRDGTQGDKTGGDHLFGAVCPPDLARDTMTVLFSGLHRAGLSRLHGRAAGQRLRPGQHVLHLVLRRVGAATLQISRR